MGENSENPLKDKEITPEDSNTSNREQNAYKRSEELKIVVHYGLLWVVGISIFVLFAMIVTLGFNLVTGWSWLEPDEIQELKDVFLSSSIAGNLFFFVRYYLLNGK